jgi:HCOMODA/2-hydroxy-3-carboxy-muconic semialdehyde decarboxylase
MDAPQRIVRLMARALARGGLVNAFGHCSVRLDERSLLVCAARPQGLIRPGEPGTVVPIDGPLPEGVLGEVRLHQRIYRRRADVNAVCRFLSPNVMALAGLGRTAKARHGFGSYFHPEVPFWPDPGLLRTDEAAEAVATTMGDAPAVVFGGNGAATAGATPEQALCLAWFLEDASRVELAALATGLADSAPRMTDAQARSRATWQGRIAERMWEYLTAGDPEA